MHTTYWHSKADSETLPLDRRAWLLVAGLAGALCAFVSPLPF